MASKDIVVKHNKLSSERIPTVFFFPPVVAVVTTAKPYDLETCMYGLTERRGLRDPFLLSFMTCSPRFYLGIYKESPTKKVGLRLSRHNLQCTREWN